MSTNKEHGLTVHLTAKDQRLMQGMSEEARARFVQQKADRKKTKPAPRIDHSNSRAIATEAIGFPPSKISMDRLMEISRQRIMSKLPGHLLKALKAVGDGCDVFGIGLATDLRQIQTDHPGLIIICKPMGNYKPTEKNPYFGCALTKLGKLVAQ